MCLKTTLTCPHDCENKPCHLSDMQTGKSQVLKPAKTAVILDKGCDGPARHGCKEDIHLIHL